MADRGENGNAAANGENLQILRVFLQRRRVGEGAANALEGGTANVEELANPVSLFRGKKNSVKKLSSSLNSIPEALGTKLDNSSRSNWK